MIKKATITPTMKLLKKNGLIRVTYERLYSYRDDKFMWYEANEGHFTVFKTRRRDYFQIEVRHAEDFEKIKNVLMENGVEFTDSFGTIINVKY